MTVLTDEVREKTKEDKIAVMIPFPPSQQSRYYYRFVHRGGGQGGGNPLLIALKTWKLIMFHLVSSSLLSIVALSVAA